MGIIWLILKVLLGIVLILIGLIVLAIVLVLTLPIDYLIELEKYDEIALYSKIKVFYILTIIYHLKEGQNILDFRVLGRQVNKEHVEMEKPKEAVKKTTEDLVHVEEKVAKETTPPFPSKENNSLYTLNQTTKETKKQSTVSQTTKKLSHVSNTKDKQKKTKESKIKKQKSSKRSQLEALWEDVKTLWESEYRKGFIIGIKKLIIQLFRAIKPKYLRFNLILGARDPAQMGEWLAVASLFYPLYGRYGCLQANFDEEGFWGEVNIRGRIRFYRILKALLAVLIDKSVRNYVKIILNIRKGERNGISIK